MLRSTDEVPAHRDRKKVATLQALRRAAVELAGAHGFAAVSVDEIAARAGVSPRTFFNYLQSKEDAVVGWDAAQCDALAQALERCDPGLTSVDALRDVLLTMYRELADDAEQLLRPRLHLIDGDARLQAHQARRFEEMERRLIEVVARRRGRRPDDDHFAELVVATTLAACRVAVRAWGRSNGRRPVTAYVEYFLQNLAVGTGVEQLSAGGPVTATPRRTPSRRKVSP